MADSAKHIPTEEGSAKAWINFNGTGTIAVRGSYNVSSIVDNGVGDYTINFTTPFASTNDMVPNVTLSFNGDTAWNPRETEVLVVSTSSIRILTGDVSTPGDMEFIYVAVFGSQ